MDKIILSPMEDVLHNSMIPYAEYVIMDRAIPRVEDGLKPVQRRILYTMYELGLTPDKPTRKCARIVGDCLGKFHPHGDTSVYGALVRMAQDFSIRRTLIDGQGNFGSIDGDTAAAMRYTEAKMTSLAMELLKDLDCDTVEFTNNFDDSLTEPVTLPGRFPNLLVNGAYGIAVGLATNIPTHNLSEVIDGTVALIENENLTLKELMSFIPAPDFSSGGYLIKSDIENAYATGRGRFFIRAKVHFEKEGNRDTIVITELPYGVEKAPLQQKIISLRETKKGELLNIAEVVDESDLDGMRVVIKLKKDSDKELVLADLFKKTDLNISFNVNMVAIANGKPKQMGLIEVLKAYIKYQIEVIVRRSKFKYEEAKQREHILKGLVIAVRNIDEVIEIIKSSKTTAEAKQRLMKRFELDNAQAQAILDLRLARLTSMEVFKLEQELLDIQALMKELQKIIKSKEEQKSVLIKELLEVKQKFGDERRTKIVDDESQIEVANGVEEIKEDNVVVLFASGKIGRYQESSYKLFTKQKPTAVESIVKDTLFNNSKSVIKAFTNFGNIFNITAESIAYSTSKLVKDKEILALKEMEDGEKIIRIFELDKEDKRNLMFFTKDGMIKKTAIEEYFVQKDSFVAIKLKEDDSLLDVEFEKENTTLFFATKGGMCLKCDALDIPSQGRVSLGVKGMNLADGDRVILTTQVENAGEIAVITAQGYGKRVIVSAVPQTARYRKGVKLLEFKAKDDCIVKSKYIKEAENILVISDTKDINTIDTNDLPIEKREGKGKLIDGLKFFQNLID